MRAGALVVPGVVATWLLCPTAAPGNTLHIDKALPQPVIVAGYGGYLGWSEFDRKHRRYRLMSAYDGRVSRLSVRGSNAPFDVNIGPGSDGKPVAVYTRCQRRQRCRIYEYSFALHREKRIRLPQNAVGSARLPTVWRSRLAYQLDGPAGRPPKAVILAGTSVSKVQMGPAGAFDPYDDGPVGSTSLAFAGSILLSTWHYWPTTQACGFDPGSASGPQQDSQLSAYRGQGDPRVLLHGGCVEDRPTFEIDGVRASRFDRITFIQVTTAARSFRVSRWNLASGARQVAVLGSGLRPDAYAEDGRGHSLLVGSSLDTGMTRLTSAPLHFVTDSQRTPALR